MAQDWAMCLVVKGECPVVWVCCVVDPGKSRASVGVDCLVSCPPSVPPVGYEPKLGSLRFVFRI